MILRRSARRSRRCCRTRRRAQPRWRRSSWDVERRCPHCASAGAVIARQGTRSSPLSVARPAGDIRRAHGHGAVGPHNLERWLAFGASLGAGETIRVGCRALRDCAEHGAARWRHRFLAAVRQRRTGLPGSRRTRPSFSRARKLDRKPRRRGGKANAVCDPSPHENSVGAWPAITAQTAQTCRPRG